MDDKPPFAEAMEDIRRLLPGSPSDGWIPPPPPIDPKSEQPDDPKMETRIAVLEQIAKETTETLKDIKGDLKGLRGDLSAVRADVAEVKGKVSNLPTTWTMLVTVLGPMIALAALLVAISRGLKL